MTTYLSRSFNNNLVAFIQLKKTSFDIGSSDLEENRPGRLLEVHEKSTSLIRVC